MDGDLVKLFYKNKEKKKSGTDFINIFSKNINICS